MANVKNHCYEVRTSYDFRINQDSNNYVPFLYAFHGRNIFRPMCTYSCIKNYNLCSQFFNNRSVDHSANNGLRHIDRNSSESKSFCFLPKIYAGSIENVADDSMKLESKTRSEPRETGWDRLRIMFAKRDSGLFSPEMEFIRTGIISAAFIGGCIGGLSKTKHTRENFRRRNMETKFGSGYAASRKMHDELTAQFMKGVFFGSLKTATLIASYMTLVVATEVYTERIGILEYVGAGVLSGSLLRLNLGLRGMVGGGFAGGILGVALGCCVKSLLWMTDMSYQDLKYWRHDVWMAQLEKREELKTERKKQKELKKAVSSE